MNIESGRDGRVIFREEEMVQASGEHTSPDNEFNVALAALTGALEDAAKAAQALQLLGPAVANLTRLTAELEDRIERARQLLGEREGAEASAARRPVALPSYANAAAESPASPEPSSEVPGSKACFLLEVRAVSSPLDLKAVDSSVNNSTDVVDVALLDFDGRRASLKVWFDPGANLTDARAALRENLQRHLGGQPAEILLERAEESAA
jgi:hypothetical protein